MRLLVRVGQVSRLPKVRFLQLSVHMRTTAGQRCDLQMIATDECARRNHMLGVRIPCLAQVIYAFRGQSSECSPLNALNDSGCSENL